MENKLLRLIKLLTTTPGTTDAINQFLEELALHHHADRAYIIEYDLSQQTLTNTFEWCAPGVESEIELLQQLDLSIVDEWNQRFADVGDFYISSVNQQLDKDSMDYKLLEMQGVESLMAAPFVKNGVIIGFLGVDNPKVAYRQANLLRATADVLMVELDKRRMLEQTERLMNEDALTGLKNRHSYISALKQIEMNLPETLGFVYVDINGLSKLNEIYGDELGDDVIIRTAQILRRHAGEHVYRIGGDEFAAVFLDYTHEAFEKTCERIRGEFEQNSEYSVSVGKTWVKCDGGVDLQQEYIRVHEVMTADKRSRCTDARHEVSMLKRGHLSTELLSEIENGRFQVYIQPKVHLETGCICGSEALVRKFDEDGRMIPPIQFISRYEVLGIQMHLDRFVLKTVIKMLAPIPVERRRGSVSVNISRVTMETPHFVRDVAEMLEKYGVEPKYLRIEITEGVAKIGMEPLKKVVDDLHAVGVQVSLDDFGTEYSNLSVLTNIDFDEVKIDKSLVDNICADHKARCVLKNVVNMCRELGCGCIVAEGVEFPDQCGLIQDLNCSHGQGYLFYKPMPMQEYVNILNGSASA